MAAPTLGDQLAMASLRDGEVMIGPVLPEDLGALFVWINDAGAAALDLPYRPTDCIAYKDWLDKVSKDSSQILFAIRRIDAPHCIGFLLFKNFHSVHRTAELGVRIGVEADRGKHCGMAALRLAMRYAWDTLNLHRISLSALAANARAIACYRGAGFHEEGLLRHGAFVAGQWQDVVLMAALNPHQLG